MDMQTNIIYNENCLETLKRMSDNSIDCVITSPPYNMNLRIRNGKYCSRQIIKESSTKYIDFNDNMPIDDYYKLHSKILKELLRVSKIIFYNIQIVTGSKRSVFKMIGEFSNQLKDIIIWDKINAAPSMQKNVINRKSELILVFDSKNAISRMYNIANFNRGEMDDIWKIKRGKKIDKSHSAVFPLALVEKIILNFTLENQIIYDPFMGLGTTALSCVKNNRKYIGSELSKEYINISKKRLDNHRSQLRIF
jgi:site-specific DNA-methyltransferase (adenine-specific)/modification methylase